MRIGNRLTRLEQAAAAIGANHRRPQNDAEWLAVFAEAKAANQFADEPGFDAALAAGDVETLLDMAERRAIKRGW
jgi:hypothetical protein